MSIDGIEFVEAMPNMQQLDVNGLLINYIGLGDFLKNKEASGRIQDIADIQEIKKDIDSQQKEKENKTRANYPLKHSLSTITLHLI